MLLVCISPAQVWPAPGRWCTGGQCWGLWQGPAPDVAIESDPPGLWGLRHMLLSGSHLVGHLVIIRLTISRAAECPHLPCVQHPLCPVAADSEPTACLRGRTRLRLVGLRL